MWHLFTYSRTKHRHESFRSSYSQQTRRLGENLRGIDSVVEQPAPARAQHHVLTGLQPKSVLVCRHGVCIDRLVERIEEEDLRPADDPQLQSLPCGKGTAQEFRLRDPVLVQ
jgi:hypothetical protein